MAAMEKKAEELALVCLGKKAGAMEWIKSHPITAGSIGGAGLGGLYSFLSPGENKTVSDWLKPVLYGTLSGGALGGAYSVGKNLFAGADATAGKGADAGAGTGAGAGAKTEVKDEGTRDPTTAQLGAIGGPAVVTAAADVTLTPAVRKFVRKHGPNIRAVFTRSGFMPESLSDEAIGNLINRFSNGRTVNEKAISNFIDSYIQASRKAPIGFWRRLGRKLPRPSDNQVLSMGVDAVFGPNTADSTVFNWLKDNTADLTSGLQHTDAAGNVVARGSLNRKAALAYTKKLVSTIPKALMNDPTFKEQLVFALKTNNIEGAEQQLNRLFARFEPNPALRKRLAEKFVDSFHVKGSKSILNVFRDIVSGSSYRTLPAYLEKEIAGTRAAEAASAAARERGVLGRALRGGTLGTLIGALFFAPDAVAGARARAARDAAKAKTGG